MIEIKSTIDGKEHISYIAETPEEERELQKLDKTPPESLSDAAARLAGHNPLSD